MSELFLYCDGRFLVLRATWIDNQGEPASNLSYAKEIKEMYYHNRNSVSDFYAFYCYNQDH